MERMESRSGEGHNLRTAAYDQFIHALREGRLELGQMLSQKDLAADLGLSVGTLRELLPRLESEGLVQVLNQRGILLPAIDLTMIRETFQLRLALEREAAAVAAEAMPPAEIAALRESHAQALADLDRDCTPAALDRAEEIDRALHVALIGCTGNGLLRRSYETNETRMRLIKLYRHALTPQAMRDALLDHQAIIEAIAARDRAAAMAAMERHIRNARNRAVML